MYLSIGETAEFLSVSISTLRRWDRAGKLNYSRVSSHDQKNDLKRQTKRLFMICHFFNIQVEIIEEEKERKVEEKLVFDVLEIITVFSAKLYGYRVHCH